MSDSEVRDWYLRKIATIPELDAEWQNSQVSLEERARRAWKIRHDARREARELMDSRVDVVALKLRDLVIYGHTSGPTFAQLVSAGRRAGLSPEETHRRIISGAQTTNSFVNWFFGRGRGRRGNRKHQRPKKPKGPGR